MSQVKDIKYVNKNFTDLRTDLVEYAKNYFPDTYNDFSPASPGMMFIEMAAYVGDVLSFYQDTQVQETFLQYAKNPSNLYTLAYTLGYKPKITTTSEVSLELTQLVDANPSANYEPDWTQALYISENSSVRGITNSTTFLLRDSVDFGVSSSYQPIPEVNEFDGNGNPSNYILKREVKAFSADIVTITETFGSAEKFTTITLDDDNIIGVLDITDSSDNVWYEVPYLGQETIFTETINTNTDQGRVAKSLSLLKTSRRFVTRFNSTGQLEIQFGAGTLTSNQEETFIPNATNVGARTNTGISRIDYNYNPSNFLYSDTYGLAPSNTTLTIRYLKGGGISSNEPANSITQKVSINTIGNTDKLSTLTVNNTAPAVGGRDGDSVEELRQNAIRAFGEQGRIVTLEDFVIRSLSMPARFGSIDKAYPVQESFFNLNYETPNSLESNPFAIGLYVLSKDLNNNLIPTSETIKSNLKTYLSQYLMLTDSVNIRDAFVVNIGINYEIIPLPGSFGRDILVGITDMLIDYFDIDKWNINQPIDISRIITLIDRMKGVQSVQKFEIINKAGGNYSEYEYDISSATRDFIVYPSLDPCVFEVKFPNQDIKGRVVGL